jgi:hypothetical protein
MRHQSKVLSGVPTRQAKHYNGVAKARTANRRTAASKRTRGGQRNEHLPFAPPENWYEPNENRNNYRIIVQPPGEGHQHVLTPQEIRDRLAQVPQRMLRSLEVVQLSCMTRKKRSFPCYGMQWGSALYLYPLEESLVEYFYKPPQPNLVNETRMYGARWVHEAPSTWLLVWSKQSIKDFYLNNILIHELGHLVDDRNNGCVDRERYAEWFAVEHGYLASQAQRRQAAGKTKPVRRRHHARTIAP